MAAASSFSLISPRVAPATPCYNGANYTTLAGRKYEILSHNPCRPVADMNARGRRKTTGQKLVNSKSQGKSWPTEGITADIRDPALLKENFLKDRHHVKEEKNVATSDQEKSTSESEISMDVGDKQAAPPTLHNTEEIGALVKNSTIAKVNAASDVAEDLEESLVTQETILAATTTLDGECSGKVESPLHNTEEIGALVENSTIANKDNAASEVAEDLEESLVTQETILAATTTLDGECSGKVESPLPDESQSELLLQNAVEDEPNDQFLTNGSDSHLEVKNRLLQVKTLSEKTALDGGKLFFYPESPKAGSEVELFLNRLASTLSQQPSVKVRGAYNDWRWKLFEADLSKTDLPGDWWSCKLQVPKEAYKLDFVFHDGGSVYENNWNKDFYVLLDNGMQKDAFEDFLLDEEWKEVKRIAAEKALEEKQIAEERRLVEKKASEEVDRREANKRANEQRERTSRIMQKAVKHVEGLWYFQPSDFQGGDTVKLFYNRSSRNLAYSKEVWMHGGYNNWQDMVSIMGRLTFHSDQGGHWWTIDVDVPKQAFVLNWVFADGPPEAASLYDNNTYQDFHALVPRGVPNDLYWRDFEDRIFTTLQEERERREEAARKKVQHTADIKEKFKEKTKSILVKSREHIFYTDPVDVQAGKEVTIFYNPTHTVLNGKPEVWLLVSFNRWTHRRGNLPLIKMLPVIDTAFRKATIKVPFDAYMMDFVFSERGEEGGGLFDNNHGMDYHVPVVSETARESPMKVVHISVEMAPIAKVGGLGDVVTSLSRAVQDLGHSVEVVLPKYDCLKYNYINNLHEKEHFHWGGTQIKVWNGTVEGLPVVFLEPQNGMCWAGCVYGHRDDGQRFGFFCNAALEYLLRSGRRPDIIHCHDWSSAPVTWLFLEQYKQSNLANARVVFTIHNLEFGTALIGRAMAFADKATTVSETYASEVSGNPEISRHLYKFSGIRNGIDLDIWDPYNDHFIPLSYTSENVREGKKAAKKELQSRLGLAQTDRPLVGIVTRLTAQKGIHLIKHAIGKTLERSGQVVLLGSAPDPRIQNDFSNLANQLHTSRGDMARLCLHYDEPLSHLIYAGSDFILIPSVFEPCGLTQLIAMRYGAIPVVRRTGGLNDTVFDVDHDRDRARYHGIEPNGFSFDGTDTGGVEYALNRALSAWYEARHWFYDLCKQVMEQDWSWNRPALDYIELYHNARK